MNGRGLALVIGAALGWLLRGSPARAAPAEPRAERFGPFQVGDRDVFVEVGQGRHILGSLRRRTT